MKNGAGKPRDRREEAAGGGGTRRVCPQGPEKVGDVAEGAWSATQTGRFWVMNHQRRSSPKTGGRWVGLDLCDRGSGKLLEKAENTEHGRREECQ